MEFDKLFNGINSPNTRYNFPFPSYPPNINGELFIKIASEEINDCNFFLNNICSKCKNPEVICIIEDLSNFMRYKKLKKCMKKVRTIKYDNKEKNSK